MSAENRSMVTLQDVSGTCDSGDPLENLHDEIDALVTALISLEEGGHADGEHVVINLLYLAQRKIRAAARVYAGGDYVPVETKAAE